MRACCSGIQGRQKVRVGHPVDGDFACAVTRWVQRISGLDHAGGLGNGAEGFFNERQCFHGVKFASNREHGVVGLVVLAVESLQVLDLYVFHIGARANGAFAVVVPVKTGGNQPRVQHHVRVVFTTFHLVAHHTELFFQVSARDEAVDHAVGFHGQHPLQVFVRGGEGLKVVGAVGKGGAVEVHATLAQLGHDVALGRRALEHQVLQQVGHTGFAVVLVPVAHQIGDVDGGGGFGRVRGQQHAQTVGQPVLGDALHRGDHGGLSYWRLGACCRRSRCSRRGGCLCLCPCGIAASGQQPQK